MHIVYITSIYIHIYIYICCIYIYIYKRSCLSSSNANLFAGDTSLSSVIHNANITAKEFNNDLVKIRWRYQRKMRFNADPSKQAQEVTFSRKTKKEYHPPLAFSSNVLETNSQKHLGVVLDNRFSFQDHLKMTLTKVKKAEEIFRKVQNILPRSARLTIYKSFIRPHLDYGDIIYDRAYNASFINASKTRIATVPYLSCTTRSNQRHFKGKSI